MRQIRPRPLGYEERIPVIWLHREREASAEPYDPALVAFLVSHETEAERFHQRSAEKSRRSAEKSTKSKKRGDEAPDGPPSHGAPAISVPQVRSVDDYETANLAALSRPQPTRYDRIDPITSAFIRNTDLFARDTMEQVSTEYDMDDEDEKFLSEFNAKVCRAERNKHHPPVTAEVFESIIEQLESLHLARLRERVPGWEDDVDNGRVPKLPVHQPSSTFPKKEAAKALAKQFDIFAVESVFDHWVEKRKQNPHAAPLLPHLTLQEPWKSVTYASVEEDGSLEQGDMPFCVEETKNSTVARFGHRMSAQDVRGIIEITREEMENLRTLADQIRKRERMKRQLVKIACHKLLSKEGLPPDLITFPPLPAHVKEALAAAPLERGSAPEEGLKLRLTRKEEKRAAMAAAADVPPKQVYPQLLVHACFPCVDAGPSNRVRAPMSAPAGRSLKPPSSRTQQLAKKSVKAASTRLQSPGAKPTTRVASGATALKGLLPSQPSAAALKAHRPPRRESALPLGCETKAPKGLKHSQHSAAAPKAHRPPGSEHALLLGTDTKASKGLKHSQHSAAAPKSSREEPAVAPKLRSNELADLLDLLPEWGAVDAVYTASRGPPTRASVAAAPSNVSYRGTSDEEEEEEVREEDDEVEEEGEEEVEEEEDGIASRRPASTNNVKASRPAVANRALSSRVRWKDDALPPGRSCLEAAQPQHRGSSSELAANNRVRGNADARPASSSLAAAGIGLSRLERSNSAKLSKSALPASQLGLTNWRAARTSFKASTARGVPSREVPGPDNLVGRNGRIRRLSQANRSPRPILAGKTSTEVGPGAGVVGRRSARTTLNPRDTTSALAASQLGRTNWLATSNPPQTSLKASTERWAPRDTAAAQRSKPSSKAPAAASAAYSEWDELEEWEQDWMMEGSGEPEDEDSSDGDFEVGQSRRRGSSKAGKKGGSAAAVAPGRATVACDGSDSGLRRGGGSGRPDDRLRRGGGGEGPDGSLRRGSHGGDLRLERLGSRHRPHVSKATGPRAAGVAAAADAAAAARGHSSLLVGGGDKVRQQQQGATAPVSARTRSYPTSASCPATSAPALSKVAAPKQQQQQQQLVVGKRPHAEPGSRPVGGRRHTGEAIDASVGGSGTGIWGRICNSFGFRSGFGQRDIPTAAAAAAGAASAATADVETGAEDTRQQHKQEGEEEEGCECADDSSDGWKKAASTSATARPSKRQKLERGPNGQSNGVTCGRTELALGLGHVLTGGRLKENSRAQAGAGLGAGTSAGAGLGAGSGRNLRNCAQPVELQNGHAPHRHRGAQGSEARRSRVPNGAEASVRVGALRFDSTGLSLKAVKPIVKTKPSRALSCLQ